MEQKKDLSFFSNDNTGVYNWETEDKGSRKCIWKFFYGLGFALLFAFIRGFVL